MIKTKQCEMRIKNFEKKIQWQFSPIVYKSQLNNNIDKRICGTCA